MTRDRVTRLAQLVTYFGVPLALIAGVTLWTARPRPAAPAPLWAPPAEMTLLPMPEPGAVEVVMVVVDPPTLDQSVLQGDELRFPLVMTDNIRPEGLVVEPGWHERDTQGRRWVVVPTRALHWGINPIVLHGVDRFGFPFERAWAIGIADRASDRWVERTLWVHLNREGFVDQDDLLDDLSDIAEAQVAQVFGELGSFSAGPLTVNSMRPERVHLALTPVTGGLIGELVLERVHTDAVADVVGRMQFIINRVHLSVALTLTLEPSGRPVLRVDDVEPTLDLVPEGEGAWEWIVDHMAWFVEVIVELLSAGPIEEALASAVDSALSRWVDTFVFRPLPPLRETPLEVQFQFGSLTINERGLLAGIDFRIDCADEVDLERSRSRARRLGRALRTGPVRVAEDFGAGESVVALWLHSDALNAALDALWRCGSLDADIVLPNVHPDLRTVTPNQVALDFDLAPLVQTGPEGGIAIGVAGVEATVRYPDTVYAIEGSAILPIVLEPVAGGRALQVGFDPDREQIALHAYCLALDGGLCVDNTLFDRIAWLAVPALPPIGATIPLPDVRLSGDDALRFEIGSLDWDAEGGVVEIRGDYRVE